MEELEKRPALVLSSRLRRCSDIMWNLNPTLGLMRFVDTVLTWPALADRPKRLSPLDH
jgi:hypothetical protein